MMRFCVLILCLAWSIGLVGQTNVPANFSCAIHKVFPSLSIEHDVLLGAKTVQDIHRQFKPEWVKEYHGVEIHTIHQGVKKVSTSKDQTLTSEQLRNLTSSDVNTDIYIRVDYLPDNTLRENDPKMYDCTFRINPNQDAYYQNGEEAMQQYLQKKVLEKVSAEAFAQYALAAVQFTVDAHGAIENVAIQESSKDEAIDAIMMQAVCDMTSWVSAKFDNGTQVSQDFVLTLGDMQSCIVPTLQIKRYE